MVHQGSLSYQFELSPDALAARLQDPEFIRRRTLAAGERNVEVTVEQLDDVVRVRCARDRQMEVPSFARKLVPSNGRTVDVQNWKKQGGVWSSDFTIELSGVPGEVHGRIQLLPRDGGCHYDVSFQVTTRVPLIGGKLAELLADKVASGMRNTARHTAEQLRVPGP